MHGFWTDEQNEVLQLVARAGDRLTIRAQQPIVFRRLVGVALTLQAKGLVRMMSTETAAYVELTRKGRAAIDGSW